MGKPCYSPAAQTIVSIIQICTAITVIVLDIYVIIVKPNEPDMKIDPAYTTFEVGTTIVAALNAMLAGIAGVLAATKRTATDASKQNSYFIISLVFSCFALVLAFEHFAYRIFEVEKTTDIIRLSMYGIMWAASTLQTIICSYTIKQHMQANPVANDGYSVRQGNNMPLL